MDLSHDEISTYFPALVHYSQNNEMSRKQLKVVLPPSKTFSVFVSWMTDDLNILLLGLMGFLSLRRFFMAILIIAST